MMNKKQKTFTAFLLIVLFILTSMLTSLSYGLTFLMGVQWTLIGVVIIFSFCLLIMGIIYCYYKLED